MKPTTVQCASVQSLPGPSCLAKNNRFCPDRRMLVSAHASSFDSDSDTAQGCSPGSENSRLVCHTPYTMIPPALQLLWLADHSALCVLCCHTKPRHRARWRSHRG